MSGTDQTDKMALKRMGIRPTRQRLAVLEYLRTVDGTHVTADQIHLSAMQNKNPLPLATVYNVLNDLAKAKIVRRIDIGPRTTFCTNRVAHHHYLDTSTNIPLDIPGEQPKVVGVPLPPTGMEIEGIDIVIRIRPIASG